MHYKLTFEDGSSAYLAHHGTKGMKWGVWNAETAARYAGKGIEGGGGGGGIIDEEEMTPEEKKRLADEKQKELEEENKKLKELYSENIAMELMQNGDILGSLKYIANRSEGSSDFMLKTGKAVVDNVFGVPEKDKRERLMKEIESRNYDIERSQKQKAAADKQVAEKQARGERVKNLQNRVASEKNKGIASKNAKEAKNLITQKHDSMMRVGPLTINTGKKNTWRPVDVLNYEIGETVSEIKKKR